MSTTGRTANTGRGPFQGLYRDRENGWIFGVCAGIAERYGFEPIIVRVITLLSLVLLFVPTILVYGLATLLLRERPLIYRGSRCERDFWRRSARHDHWRTS